ncbi:MAG: LuxR C-terminal-related transcriptional regulator [Qipengyuania sp.]|nr:LuxR C-terminal-related transcriptional regulator [Qipengyuania sp.]
MAQHWADRRHAGAAAAWVPIKECRHNLQLLAERICAQLSATCEAGGRDTPPAPPTESPPSLYDLADWLRDTRDRLGSKVVICLDDLEFDLRSLEQIEDFMLAAPAGVEFIAATSSDTGFARMKARQEIQELRTDALAFTFEEAKAAACGREGPAVSEAEIYSLWKRTKGWPEVFCLLMQAASESRPSPDRLIADHVTGRDIDLDKYFRITILNSLADDVLEFCVCASILGSISADYFNHVFRRNDGAYYIDKLSADQMVLRALDRSQTAYEFHPLLREFLEHRFSVEHRGSKPNLLARAAQWQRQNNNSRESISLSLRAGENESAAEVASENMMDIALRQGEIDQIQSWQSSFSAAVVSGAPTIALGLAWAQIFSHDHQRAGGLLADLRAIDLGGLDQQARRQMECWCDLITAIGEATGDNLTESRRQCEAWIKVYDEADLVCKGAILTCLCFIAASEHRFDDLRKACLEASSVNNIADHRYALGWLHSAMIFAELSRGDMRAGAALLRKARDDDTAEINTTPFSVNLLNTLELELQYEVNQLDGLETRVDEILDFVRQHGIVDFTFSAYRTAAAIVRRNGDLKGAVELLQDMRVIAGEFGFFRLDVLARLTLADLFVVESAEQATAILPNRGHPVFLTSHGPYLRARQSLTEARIAARQGKFHLSNRLANVALDHARRSELGRLEVAALLCTAVAWAGTGRAALSEQRVADAIDMASRLGCYRTLLDERWHLQALGSISTPLLNLIPSQEELGCREPAPGDHRVRSPNSEASVVLTRKELAMLHRIREGLSNRDISIKHRISEDTVKWHIRNIFSKLMVRNRVQALLKAERIGILR